MLYASLAASLFSALLAMLGKQWLNRYKSTDMQGTVIERNQNRQQKLNGIISWYFGYVMEALPLMLQAALLLLGCALCRYLWEINTTIASVVLGVTSFGVIFYISIVVAGTMSKSCPYQTPGSRILRSVPSTVASVTFTIGLVARRVVRGSKTASVLRRWTIYHWPLGSIYDVAHLLKALCLLPMALVIDIFHLGGAAVMRFAHQIHMQLFGELSTPVDKSAQKMTLLDLQCISWMLQTSLDKAVHLSALESLATMVVLDDFYPTLVVDCFNILINCVRVIDGTVVIVQQVEQLAMASAICLLHTLSHLLVIDPTSNVVQNVHQRYRGVFPNGAKFDGPPFPHALCAIHSIVYSGSLQWPVSFRGNRLSSHEHITSAHAFVKLSQSGYQVHGHVPNSALDFVLYSLFLDPLPCTSVVVDCLTIVAIYMGCDTPSSRTVTLDERYVHI